MLPTARFYGAVALQAYRSPLSFLHVTVRSSQGLRYTIRKDDRYVGI